MKKANPWKTSVAASGLLLILYAFSPSIVHAGDGVPLRLVRHSLIVVPVYVNGEGPHDFLLDTGTDSTLITPELATRLRLRPTGRILLITVGGERVVPRARLFSLSMGTKSVGGGEALVADIDGIRALDSRICGVVGQNFLSQFNYVLDYRGRRVVFEEEKAAPPSGMRLPIEQFEGRLLINTRLTSSSKGRPLRLILDSAATGIVIRRMPTPTSGLDIELTGNEWAKAATVAGVRMMRMARFKALGIGSETFFNLPVAVAQSGEEIESGAEDGLLPTSLFRSVYFNNREGYVILNPNFPE